MRYNRESGDARLDVLQQVRRMRHPNRHAQVKALRRFKYISNSKCDCLTRPRVTLVQ